MYQEPTEVEILLNGLLNMRHLRSDDLKKQQIQLIISELEKETPAVASVIETNQNSSPATSLAQDEDNNNYNTPSPVPLVEKEEKGKNHSIKIEK